MSAGLDVQLAQARGSYISCKITRNTLEPLVLQGLTSLKAQHLLLGMPRRRCSLWKPLKVAFKAWLITALLQGVSKGSS